MFSSTGAVRVPRRASNVQNGLLLAALRHYLYGSRDEGGTETSRLLLLAREKLNALLCHVDGFYVSVYGMKSKYINT